MKDRNISYEDIEEDYVITSKPTYLELEQEIARLKKEINTYENPDDLTLMFMWCDEKAKDKIKEQTLEIARLKELCDKYEDEHRTTFEIWKNDIQRINKAIEYIKEHSEMTNLQIYGIENVLAFRGDLNELLEILGDDKE